MADPVLSLSDTHGVYIPQIWCADLTPEEAERIGIQWADEQLDSVPEKLLSQRLGETFRRCCDDANEYWQEEQDHGFWIDLKRVAEKLTLEDLKEISGHAEIKPSAVQLAEKQWEESQRWRTEPYPWVGADPAPLL